MSEWFRPYTGSADEIARDARRLRLAMHLELCGLERRLWTEDLAGKHVKDALPVIRESLADMQRFLREIEDTLVSVEEEQDAAKETISDAA